MIFYYKPSMTGKVSTAGGTRYKFQTCKMGPKKPVIHGISITIYKAMFSTFHPKHQKCYAWESLPRSLPVFSEGFWFGSLIPRELTRTKNPWEVIIWCQKHVSFFLGGGLIRRVSDMFLYGGRSYLVGCFNPFEKKLVKLDHFPKEG